MAANEDEFTASTIAYGTWQVKKLYLHLYPENQITFDWTVPLKSMNGATGIELAEEAYTLHKGRVVDVFEEVVFLNTSTTRPVLTMRRQTT